MKSLLIVLNPREIPEAEASLRALPIDKVWVRGHTEASMVPAIAELVANSSYDAHLMVSDDVVASPDALRAVLRLLEYTPVATGYCPISRADPRVNLLRAPLLAGETCVLGPYFTAAETRNSAEPVLRTWFAGWMLTGMRRELWERFTFAPWTSPECPQGYGSDHHLSLRLQEAGIPIYAHRDAYCEHLKDGNPQPWRSGPPELVWDVRGPDAGSQGPGKGRSLRGALHRADVAYRRWRRSLPSCCLLPLVSGWNPYLGELRSGEPHWTNAAGLTLAEAEIRALAASSRHLRLLHWPEA